MHLRAPFLLPLLLVPAIAPASVAQDLAPPVPATGLFAPAAQVVYDTPGDGLLWARGATYKASFGPDGATYIPFLGSDAPRNQPVRLRLAAARVGDRALALNGRASWSRDGDSVTLDRGAVDVRYQLGLQAVEQTFHLDTLVPDGDLVVELEVESELSLRAAGAGFELAGERGGVRYGSATVLDADGRSLALESRVEGTGLAIRVPRAFLETARQPLVIDPVITTYAVNAGPTGTFSGDVSYDATHGLFMHAFAFLFSQADYDMYSVPVQLDGTVRHDLGLWIDVSDTHWSQASIANSNADDNFLVVAEATYGAESGVYGRIRQLPGLGIGPVVQISAGGAPECRLPSVGGEVIEGGSSRYCVVWVEEQAQASRQVRHRILSSTGAYVTAPLALDAAPNNNNWRARVSDSSGHGLSGERLWNVVWTRFENNEGDIHGAQIARNGDLATPPFVVDSRSINHGFPDVASPLLGASGGPRDFVAVYTAHLNGQSDLHARLFKGDDFQASFDLGELEADVIGDQMLGLGQGWPTVATDGTQLIVVYSEFPAVGEGSDLRLSTFHHNGASLFPNEVHQLVASGGGEHQVLAEVATVHDSGLAGAPVAGISWLAGNGSDSSTMGALYLRPAGWKPLGTTTCAGLPNSTGSPATFRAYGSDDVQDARVFLDVDNLPPFQWGYFLMAQQTGVVAAGNGFLCLGEPIFRLTGTTTNSWLQGAIGVELDLGNLPVQVLGGETWTFQYWYRDGASFNFSNALEIAFE